MTSGSASELYFYDAAGMRQAVVSMQSGSVTKVRAWFGATEIEYSSTGTVNKTRTDLVLDGTVARVEDRATLEYVYANHLGHTVCALAANGQMLAGFNYGFFGEVLETLGSSSEQGDWLRRFNGKEYDVLSGLSYYGHRYYDRLSMTWTQADPLYRFVPDLGMTSPRRQGLYVFSLNNPLRWVDPDGLDAGPTEEQHKKANAAWIRATSGKKKTAGGRPRSSAKEAQEGDGAAGVGTGSDPRDKRPGGATDGEIDGHPEGSNYEELGFFQKLWAASGYTIHPDTVKAIEGLEIVAAVFPVFGLANIARSAAKEATAVSSAGLAGLGNIGSHGAMAADDALRHAETWLGRGYREIGPKGSGVFRSLDGTRQFRMTTADLVGSHGNMGPHIHFEALNAQGRVIENLHIPFVD